MYNVGGLSSSLLKPQGAKWWQGYTDMDPRTPRIFRSDEYKEAQKKPRHTMQIVPVMPMKMLINAISPEIVIEHLHTDMQGYDFVAVKSAGHALTRIRSVQAEVYTGPSEYEMGNATNSLDNDWKPYMTSLGYKLDKLVTYGKNEADGFWILP